MKKMYNVLFPAIYGKDYPSKESEKTVLFSKQTHEGDTLTLSHLLFGKDMEFIHRWMNMPYSEQFWDMAYDKSTLTEHYLGAFMKGKMIPLMVFLDQTPIGFAEVVPLAYEEIASHVDVERNSVAMHLLMAPPRFLLERFPEKAHGLSLQVVGTLLDYLFTKLPVSTVLLEPDERNKAAHRIAEKAGFVYKGDYRLASKNCRLYAQSKDQFLASKKHSV